MALITEVSWSYALIWRTLGVLFGATILRFFYRLYHVRTMFRNVSKQHGIVSSFSHSVTHDSKSGLTQRQPIMPHSFLFGHLIAVGKLVASQAPEMSGMYIPLLLLRENPELFSCGVAYIDTWPFGPPMLAVFHPDIMAQFTQETSLPKYELMATEFRPFTQLNDLVNQEGQEWKKWRSIFNPGFSAKNLISLVPQMIEEVLIFRDWLKNTAASGQVTKLEDQVSKTTIDVIGRVVL